MEKKPEDRDARKCILPGSSRIKARKTRENPASGCSKIKKKDGLHYCQYYVQDFDPANDYDSQRGHDLMGMKILLVDDEQHLRSSLSIILELAGYQVSTAENGIEAVKIIAMEETKGRFFDLVITDLCMPKMDGIELTTWVKTFNKETKVILFSAFEKKDLPAGVAATLDVPWLVKPFESETFLAKIEAVLGPS